MKNENKIKINPIIALYSFRNVFLNKVFDKISTIPRQKYLEESKNNFSVIFTFLKTKSKHLEKALKFLVVKHLNYQNISTIKLKELCVSFHVTPSELIIILMRNIQIEQLVITIWSVMTPF